MSFPIRQADENNKTNQTPVRDCELHCDMIQSVFFLTHSQCCQVGERHYPREIQLSRNHPPAVESADVDRVSL
jgi:hypothetical protein